MSEGPIHVVPLLVIVALCSALPACRSQQQRAAPSEMVSSAVEAECSSTLTLTLGVAGDYGFEATGDGAPFPYAYLDFRVEQRTVPIPRRKLLSLPEYPAVTEAPRDLCSARRRGNKVDLACLDDRGAQRSVTINLDEVARSVGFGPKCLRFQNLLADTDLDRLSQQWRRTADLCADADPPIRRTAIIMELRRPPEDSGCYIEGSPTPTCVIVHLSAAGIALSRVVGRLSNYPVCSARHLTNPRGVRLACSDLTISQAAVYRHGNRVFYRSEEESDAGSSTGSRLRSFELPCGIASDFAIRSYEPVRWGD
jgi:hypothetical protein